MSIKKIVKKKITKYSALKDAPEAVQQKILSMPLQGWKHLCQYHQDLVDGARQMERMVHNPKYKTFISYSDISKNPSGFAIIHAKDKDTMYLDYLCAKEGYAKGLGVGSKLLEMAESYAKKKGYKKMVGEGTQSALSFYMKNGYS